MILYEWKNFGTETDIYTRESFEAEIGDEFEAMMFDEKKDIPSLIWTKNFVVNIKPIARMYRDVSFVKIPRNPSSAK
ncbi:hypothetical protein NC661_17200 [Aquibacillus koreensis]|uniref:Uncharacterized protein n=1 Tax=Aquibacillus koreensis TaxID=279446 RepID=A0A9X3WRK7_9BACI|nr:hypothetical protein [Aquibacillus koreensis]MCT2536175.1 hypothetical protein [Aquibacillus koreensis]MDC3422099.1 hypothetical protein [Aquibacillus koreensis]